MSSGFSESCIVIENARIGGEGLGSIVLGSVGTILPAVQGDVRTFDAGGRIVVPAFAEPHAHLDRAFSQAITGANQTGTLLEAIRRFHASIGLMALDALAPGATRALTMLAAKGVAHVRTHTIVGGEIGFQAWEAVELAASAVPAVQVQQVMMPLGGLVDHPDTLAWTREAAARGAVALGGAPWLAEDPSRATRAAAEVAAGLGIGLDNIRDVIVGVGTADPLRAAWLLALAGHLTGEDDLSRLGETLVRGNRVICGIPEGLSPGNAADLLVIDATSLAEAIALVPSRQRLCARTF